jgi:hypothetical protein
VVNLQHLTGGRLKSGPRVHIFVGPADDQFIGVEGAYINILTHYSKYAKTKLLAERVPGLVIVDGSKTPVKWIYKYMLVGENDPEGLEKFDDLAIADLVLVYSHCAVLEYQPLMDRILARLHKKLFYSLPDVPTIKNIAIFAPSVNKLVAKAIARIIVQPLMFDYGPYMQHAAEDDEFSSSVSAEVEDMLQRRIATGLEYYAKNVKHRRNAQRTRISPAKTQVTVAQDVEHVVLSPESKGPLKKKSRKPRKPRKSKKVIPQAESTPKAAELPENNAAPVESAQIDCEPNTTTEAPAENRMSMHTKPNRVSKPYCYACRKRGHRRRDCPSKHQDGTANGPAIITVNPVSTDHDEVVAENIVEPTKEEKKKAMKRSARAPPVCFACNEEGHVVRNCPTPPAAYIQEKAVSMSSANGVLGDIINQPRSSYARNKTQRRAKAERIHYAPITDSGNAEW